MSTTVYVKNVSIDALVAEAQAMLKNNRIPFFCLALTGAMGMASEKLDHCYDTLVFKLFSELTGYDVEHELLNFASPNSRTDSLSANERESLLCGAQFKSYSHIRMALIRMIILLKIQAKHPDYVFDGFPVAEME